MLTTSSCGAGDLSGAYQFDFASGSSVVVTVDTANGLNCISIEEMGGDHLVATGTPGNSGIHTGNWWHISGNITTGFVVTVTLPHANLLNPKVCKFSGTQGGYGWDCFRTNFNGSTVWLDNVTSFSDWAVGGDVGPTAVTLQSFSANSNLTGWQSPVALVVTSIIALIMAGWYLRRRRLD